MLFDCDEAKDLYKTIVLDFHMHFVGGGGDLDDFMVICFPPPPPYGRGVYYKYVDNISQKKQADKCYCGCCWMIKSGDYRQCCQEYYWSP